MRILVLKGLTVIVIVRLCSFSRALIVNQGFQILCGRSLVRKTGTRCARGERGAEMRSPFLAISSCSWLE